MDFMFITILLSFYRSAEGFQGQEQGLVLTGKRNKTVVFTEIAGAIVFGIHKQTYASGLIRDENGSMYCLCEQKGSVSLALMPERYCKPGEAHCRQVVLGIHGKVRRREMFCGDLTKRKREESQNDCWLVTIDEDKGTGESFFSMLSGCGLEKCIQFCNATIKGSAIVFAGKRLYFEHRRFFLC